ncbi:fd00f18b-08f8-4c2e-a6fc-c770cc45fdb4 [Sclerotinia trifoliorum]|uniref:Fd00f18b-08f8-4c2e-a6fc-c770cc45fdb4 n=1 Tax=Sclerotinia trifoliorum TaxID=28548 RepID=A0A8H2ZVJ4_9HELO|nr:fd00f18b-08f8-4c2e-a6fc-c770cc45fdb4 [Sclerotinia trifoliorum]
MGKDQEEPLLSSAEVLDELSQDREAHHAAKESATEAEKYRPASDRTKRYRNSHILLTVGLVISYIPAISLFVASGTRFQRHAANLELLPDLAKEAKVFEVQKFPSGFRSSPYAGPPSEELDAAWHELFEYNDIRGELEDLQAIGMESLPLTLYRPTRSLPRVTLP